MAVRAINTVRNYSAGTENLQKSGHTICECRHQVSYIGTTIMQGKERVTDKHWEDIFPPYASSPSPGARAAFPGFILIRLPSFTPSPPISPNSQKRLAWYQYLDQPTQNSGATKGPSGLINIKYDAKQGKKHIYFLWTIKQSTALLTLLWLLSKRYCAIYQAWSSP